MRTSTPSVRLLALAASTLVAATLGCATGSAPSTEQPAPVGQTGGADITKDGGAGTMEPVEDITHAQALVDEASWGNYLTSFDEAKLEAVRSMYTELPTEAYVLFLGEGGGAPRYLDGPAEMRAAFNALARLNLLDETDTMWTDDDTSFVFELADGTTLSFIFNGEAAGIEHGDGYTFYDLDKEHGYEGFAAFKRLAFEYTPGD